MDAKALFVLVFLSIAATASSLNFQPVVPPSVPLAVRTPYLSAWLPAGTHNGGKLAGIWPQFWTSGILGWAGIVRVDGVAYQYMGNPAQAFPNKLPNVTQTNASYTSTQSVFHVVAGAVDLTIVFLSPVTPNDLLRQSLPFSYVSISAVSNDAKAHDVQIYMDIDGSWAVGDTKLNVTWRFSNNQQAPVFVMSPTTPFAFSEVNQMSNYGGAYFAARQGKGVSVQSGESSKVRSQFMATGVLSNQQDTNYRRANDMQPVVAIAVDIGAVGPQSNASALFVIGHVRDPAIQYVIEDGAIQQRSTYFFSKYPNPLDALLFFINDFDYAWQQAALLDAKVQKDSAAISADYAIITSLSVRQAFGGIEITVGKHGNVYNATDIYVFMKEISSDGNANTVDVIMPSHPIFLYSNPKLLGYLLEPLLRYQASKQYPNKWAMHDMGSHYPNATGYPRGNDELMPIEESGNMLIMALAHFKFTNDSSLLQKYHPLFRQWSDYLLENTLIPGNQLATTDAAGKLANQTNLAIKGIIGLYCMSEIATIVGPPLNASYWKSVAADYLPKWHKMSLSSDGNHIKLAYQEDASWGIQFNLFADRYLHLNFIPEDVYQMLDKWYLKMQNPYGLQLDTRVSWGKTDWNMWCAAASSSTATRDMFIETVVKYIKAGISTNPFCDRFSSLDGTCQGNLRARPTVGAHFALLI